MSDARRRMHLVGIGGSGMAPLAHLLHQAGHDVTGSNSHGGEAVNRLRTAGITVHLGHDARHVANAEVLVFSPAIPFDNPERLAARRLGLPAMRRADALAGLLTGHEVIAVAGSHGKSTTSALLTLILRRAGMAPGHMVGASSPDLDGVSGHLGAPQAPFVLEACEAFGALDAWQPSHAVITSLDDEHDDHYDPADGGLDGAFHRFVRRLPADGRLVVNGDDPRLIGVIDRPALTCGFGDACDRPILPEEDGFRLAGEAETSPLIRHRLHGRHMMANIAAAVTLARALGVDWPPILDAVAGFDGLSRRFETVATIDGVRVIDDFAHHPTEIAATVAAARALTVGRLIAVVEPQLFSRASRLAQAYAAALDGADHTLLLPVNGAGEPDDGGTGDAALSAALTEHCIAFTTTTQAGLADTIEASAGDTVLVMSGRALPDLAQAVIRGVTAQPAPADTLALQIGPTRPGDPPASLVELFLAKAARTPEAPALAMDGRTVSYGVLSRRVHAIAATLLAEGLQPGATVAVCLRGSPERVSSFLGVLLAGGVYLPVDPGLPEMRIRLMLDDAAAGHVLCDATLAEALTEGRTRLRPDACTGTITPVIQPPSAPAYIIYTSGTTGRPKGVVVPHGALARFTAAAQDAYQLSSSSRISLFSAFGFDVHVGEMAMAMAAGACLVLLPDGHIRAGGAVARCVESLGVTHLSLTPSAAATVPLPHRNAPSHLILIGEACPTDLVARWHNHGITVINSYGPAEATVAVTATTCRTGEPVTIGTAFADTGIYIADNDLRPVARGETGELCIFGPCLATGYLNQRALTAQKFPTVGLPGLGQVRIYRTGDRATMRSDGQILFHGRDGDQVKLRGHRIELGEIEGVLRRGDGVADAWARLWRGPGDTARLVAYVAADETYDGAKLHRHLVRTLPTYMVPDAVIRVDSLPLTANGKRDLAALPVPESARPGREAKPPVTATELRLAQIWRDILALPGEIGIRDSLADLGADSLQTANLFLAVEDAFATVLAFDRIEDIHTIELMALHIEAGGGAPAPAGGGETGEDLIHRQTTYLVAWQGHRLTPRGMVISRNTDGRRPPLFWCFQGTAEHAELADRLGSDQPLHGLRSGHLVMTTTAANLDALAAVYADELSHVQPAGSFLLGGNCQGASLAHHLALELKRRGREVARLILMEQSRFLPYGGPVALIFGRDSAFNPFGLLNDPHAVFRAAYPGGYSVDLIDGVHGHYFRPPNSLSLAEAVRRLLARDRSLEDSPGARPDPGAVEKVN